MEQIYRFTLSGGHINETLYFDLEEEYHNIQLKFELEDTLRFKSFILLADPSGRIRLQREISHGELCYQVGQSTMDTSMGGCPGPLPKGRWTIKYYCMYPNFKELFQEGTTITLKVTYGTADVPLDIAGTELWTDYSGEQGRLTLSLYDDTRVLSGECKWYDGDFHTHTRLSDGKSTVSEAMSIAACQELAFYVPTEHNVIHTGFSRTDRLIIPGIEITTEFGHLNCFGIKELPKGLEEILKNPGDKNTTEQAILTIMEENKKKGVINSVNHPFLYPWSWEFMQTPLGLIDTIEIENDPTYTGATESNEKALKLLDFLWADGHQIYGIGGSDAHNLPEEPYEGSELPSIIGDPRTSVYSTQLSAKEILTNVKMGHTCVSRFLKMKPAISLWFDSQEKKQEYLPGDRLPEECTQKTFTLQYKIKLQNAKEACRLRLLVNGTPAMEQTVQRDKTEIVFTYQADPAPYLWIRMDVRSIRGEFIGYINPVYAGETISRMNYYDEVLSAFQ